MSVQRPSRLAMAVLEWATAHNEALMGDVLEEFQRRQSPRWLWTQAWCAVRVRSAWRSVGVDDGTLFHLNPTSHPATRPIMPRGALAPVQINMSGIHAEGVGGLGLLALVIVVTIAMPAAWWLAVSGLVGGVLMGATLVALHHRHGLSKGDGAGPGEMFDLHDEGARPARGTATSGIRVGRLHRVGAAS